MDDTQHKSINRVVLACVQCRGRHVKCDAHQPTCNRCKKEGKECVYQKSRRGGLDKAALARRKERLQQQAVECAQNYAQTIVSPSPDPSRSGSIGTSLSGVTRSTDLTLDAIRVLGTNSTSSSQMAFQVSTERLLDIYYENYWSACPAPLPKHYLNRRRVSGDHGMQDLLLVLQYIGSLFAPWTFPELYYELARDALESLTVPQTPWTVLALLLFATAQLHTGRARDARRTLDTATSMAMELSMNTTEISVAYGEGSPVLEESWRRTYHMLALTDQHFSIIVNKPVNALMNVPNLVQLPCDDEYYESGVCTPLYASRQRLMMVEHSNSKIMAAI